VNCPYDKLLYVNLNLCFRFNFNAIVFAQRRKDAVPGDEGAGKTTVIEEPVTALLVDLIWKMEKSKGM
jgi:hypothetical protein